MTNERMQELDREWDLSDQMDDEEYRDWYEGLTGEEQALIDAWDKQYNKGTLQICSDILDREKRKPSIEFQIAAAQAQQLRQRAERLPGTHDIIQELKRIEEAARKPETAAEGQAKGKDLANVLNALEGEIRGREARIKKEEQKELHGMLNAAEDLTDSFTSR